MRVPPSGTWEHRRADRYGVAEDWIGPSSATAAAGRDLLVRRYLAAFGPASRKDVATFTGLPATVLAPVIERLPLRTFRDEAGGELLDVRGAPLPDADVPAPVRFLPTFDATLLVHARRTQILPERFRPLIFHYEEPAVGADVPGRRAGGGHLEARRREDRAPTVRAASPCRAA